VSPGFIDIHTHCDRGIIEVPTVDNYLLQGVTTVIGGNCGGHPFPLSRLFAELEEEGVSVNFGCLAGHNTIRSQVMGYDMGPPAPEQLQEMCELVRREMRAGAWGLSTGLAYLPGTYSDTQEIVALAEAAAPFGGVYATHLRDQGAGITGAIEEAVRVGEATGMTVQISHIKLADDSVWGQTHLITGPVEAARNRNLRVFLDQYPYTATSSGFTSSLPSWAFEGGPDEFRRRLEDPELLEKIKAHVIERRLSSSRGIDKLDTILVAACEAEPALEGKTLKEILSMRELDPSVENAALLIIDMEKRGGAQGIFFQMDEADVESLMRLDYTIHASDGGIQVPGESVPHPRNYGTFPRIFARYIKERGVLKLAEALYKMTALPAQVFAIRERGLLKTGYFADIAIFDFEDFTDQATYAFPHRYGRGLAYVLVNGGIVVEHDRHTGLRTGRVLYGPGKADLR
jgi:N-acyl-D-amino-acid deacylase